MKINRENVLRVAELAHLELTDAEVETYRSQLDAILTYVDKLNELDTSKVEPMAQVLASDAMVAQMDRTKGVGGSEGYSAPGAPELREDVEVPCHTAEAVLKIAPDPCPPYFRVPRVIER